MVEVKQQMTVNTGQLLPSSLFHGPRAKNVWTIITTPALKLRVPAERYTATHKYIQLFSSMKLKDMDQSVVTCSFIH